MFSSNFYKTTTEHLPQNRPTNKQEICTNSVCAKLVADMIEVLPANTIYNIMYVGQRVHYASRVVVTVYRIWMWSTESIKDIYFHNFK